MASVASSLVVSNTDAPEDLERSLRAVVRALVPEMRAVADSGLHVSKFVGGITNSCRAAPSRRAEAPTHERDRRL